MPTTAYVITTNRCNMCCSYCYEREFFKDKFKDMDLDTLNKVSDFLISNAQPGKFAKDGENIGIYYFGGEPSLNWDVIRQNIAYNKKLEKDNNIKFGLYFLTNAYEFPEPREEFLKTLKENNVKIQISLDGCQQAHDTTRGSFDRIIENVKAASAYLGRTPIIRMSVTAENIHHAYDSFVAMDKLSCVVHMTLIPESDWTKEHIKIAKKEFSKIGNYYLKATHDRPIRFNIAEACTRRGFVGCQAGQNMVGVDVDGNIYPCHRFTFHENSDEWKMGDIYNGINKYPNFKEYFKKCESCSGVICHPCPSQMILSRKSESPPLYCAMYKTIQEIITPIAEKVYDYNKDQVIIKTLVKLLGEVYDERPKKDPNS